MRIGILIQNWRRIQDIGIRDTAKMIGISHSTLSRVERGENTDSATLTKILKWILE
jgi:transcriptional regulator with XRE-family HTH domain